MKVFISWSGVRSKAIAEALRDWLPTIIQSLEPFISTQDIPPGDRGLNVLALELQECSFGILCLTRENTQQPWINFEAGALSKAIEVGRVVPLLFDLKPSDITGPLTQFQAVNADNKADVFKLMQSLSEVSGPPRIADHILRRTFDTFWPELEVKITELQRTGEAIQGKEEVRGERDLLEEILTLSRRSEHELARIAQTSSAQQGEHATPVTRRARILETENRARILEASLLDKLRAIVPIQPNIRFSGPPIKVEVDALVQVGDQSIVFELKYSSNGINVVKRMIDGFIQAQNAARSVMDSGVANVQGVLVLVVGDLVSDDELERLVARAKAMTSDFELVKNTLVTTYSDFLALSSDDLIGRLDLE